MIALGETVSHFLTLDHDIILAFFTKDNFVNMDEALKYIQQAKWQTEKHIYCEEKTFWGYCEVYQKFDPTLLRTILAQHDQILQNFSTLIEKIIHKKSVDIGKLINELKAHMDFEIKEFYTLLDKNLHGQDHQKLINMIQKDVNVGYYPLEKLREYGKKFLASCEK